MEAATDLIRAIGAILWPVILIGFLIYYRSELRDLIKRVRRGKVPGVEFELDPELDQLERTAEQAEDESEAAQKALISEFARELDEAGKATHSATIAILAELTADIESQDRSREILLEASRSPRAALMALGADIESAARKVLAASTAPSNWEGKPLLETVRKLPLTPSLLVAVGQFRLVRNRIVHGYHASDEETLRAIDSGLKILRAVEALPREVHVVSDPHIDVYSDPDATQRWEDDVHGVMLETLRPSGERVKRVFPTTRDHFERGKPVTWEWNSEKHWHQSWYRDPDDSSIRLAWDFSEEFVGRNLNEI